MPGFREVISNSTVFPDTCSTVGDSECITGLSAQKPQKQHPPSKDFSNYPESPSVSYTCARAIGDDVAVNSGCGRLPEQQGLGVGDVDGGHTSRLVQGCRGNALISHDANFSPTKDVYASQEAEVTPMSLTCRKTLLMCIRIKQVFGRPTCSKCVRSGLTLLKALNGDHVDLVGHPRAQVWKLSFGFCPVCHHDPWGACVQVSKSEILLSSQ